MEGYYEKNKNNYTYQAKIINNLGKGGKLGGKM